MDQGPGFTEAEAYHQRGPLEHTLFVTFWTLSEALSRLYQRRFLRPRPHFSAFFKLYIFSFAPFQISVIFQAFAPLFANFVDFLRIFKEDSRFYRFSPNFNGILPEFRRISKKIAKSDVKIATFQRNLRKTAENLLQIS